MKTMKKRGFCEPRFFKIALTEIAVEITRMCSKSWIHVCFPLTMVEKIKSYFYSVFRLFFSLLEKRFQCESLA
jgi:hypothetical protein